MHSLGDDWAFHSPSFCILLFDYISYLSLWSLTLPKSQRAGKRARKYLGLMFCSYNHNHFHFLQTNAGIFFVETLIPVPKKFNGNFILFSWKTFPKTNVSCFIKKNIYSTTYSWTQNRELCGCHKTHMLCKGITDTHCSGKSYSLSRANTIGRKD